MKPKDLHRSPETYHITVRLIHPSFRAAVIVVVIRIVKYLIRYGMEYGINYYFDEKERREAAKQKQQDQ